MSALQVRAIVRSKEHQRLLVDLQRRQALQEVAHFGVQVADDCCMVLGSQDG